MRDAILDRVFQPAVNRLGIAPRPFALEMANAFCAIEIAAQSRVVVANVDLVGPAISTAIAVALMQTLRTSARHGSSLLSGRFGLIHMLARSVLLGVAIMNLASMTLAFALRIPGHGYGLFDAATALATLTASISLYVGVCDQPPRRTRQGTAYA